jgi:hypothetical protein
MKRTREQFDRNERKKSTNGRSKGKRLPSPQARLGGPLHDGATSAD